MASTMKLEAFAADRVTRAPENKVDDVPAMNLLVSTASTAGLGSELTIADRSPYNKSHSVDHYSVGCRDIL